MLTRKRAPRLSPEPQRALAELLDRPRYEVLPLPGVEDTLTETLPAHATVTITASARRGMTATLELAERLAARGLTVVPHLSARLIGDEAHLKEILDHVARLGIHEVFVIGGDRDQPVGSFTGALDLLVAMDQLGHGLVVGIAGYPEHHPKISDDVTVQAMWDKRHYASYIVSQMCFDAGAIVRWVDRVRRRGIDLPIYAGVPGPATTRQLLGVSRRIGVGESVRFLAHHGAGLLQVAQPGLWRPDPLLEELAPHVAQPQGRLCGLHVYTFNDVAVAEQWRRETQARLRQGEVA